MSKNKNIPSFDGSPVNTEQQPAYIDVLLKNGSVTLTSDSRESIYNDATELVGKIPQDVKWTRGAVEHREGIFYQTYDIIKN